jgi:NADPH:quinone reductase
VPSHHPDRAIPEPCGIGIVIRVIEDQITTLRPGSRVIVYGAVGDDAAVYNWELIQKHQIHIIGLDIGRLIQAAPHIFGEVMGELFALVAARVLTPGEPAVYGLADGPKALAQLEARATVGKLALRP